LTWIPDEWKIVTIKLKIPGIPPIPITLETLVRGLGMGLPLILVGGVITYQVSRRRRYT